MKVKKTWMLYLLMLCMLWTAVPLTAQAQKTGTEFTGTSFRTSDFDNNAAITLNLTADAVLTIDADKTIGGLEIYDGGYTLTVKGTKTLNTAQIRMADTGTFSMESGTISVSVSAENALLIEQGTLQMKGGTLRITGKDPESDAAHIAGDVNMSGGILHANAIAVALAVEGNCVLTGGKITAYSAQRDAILTLGSFTIDGSVTAEVGIPGDGSPIYADGGIQLGANVSVITPAGGKPDAEYGCYIADAKGVWDTIQKVEILKPDHTLIAGFVSRAYQEILLREPDTAGLNYWVDLLAKKQMGGGQMCAQFLSSREFQNRKYASDKIVDICYRAFFDRAGDEGGKAYWKDLLDNGMSVTFIARGMANSKEFGNICSLYGILQGDIALTQNRDKNVKVTGFVSRCYKESLGRNGDADGLNYWTGALLTKTITPAKVAEQFVFSKEMTNKKLGNSDFVKMLYRLCMGRTFDQGGLDYWLGQMGKGMTRQQVFTSFVNSREFRNIVSSYGL